MKRLAERKRRNVHSLPIFNHLGIFFSPDSSLDIADEAVVEELWVGLSESLGSGKSTAWASTSGRRGAVTCISREAGQPGYRLLRIEQEQTV